ncbi:hypothetical protein FACS189437_02320 [Bacteroidia bacterium]|nr:hypothetical protein FACS189437_02320 [Bacteroidia bacterium]
MKINYIQHTDIDKERYDRCILNARQGTIYAMSWYLDTVAPGWQLLATTGYSFIMPVPQKKKFGIPYVIQPILCQQLGVFSAEEITKEVYDCFVKKIPGVYCVLQLNNGNVFDQKELRPNYVLDIRPDYETIRSRYHSNTRNDLKKIAKSGLIADNQTEAVEVIELVKEHSPHYTGKLLTMARKLVKKACEKDIVRVRCVRDESTSELLAGALFFQWKNRLYYLLPISTPDGKKVRAMRFLIDRFIAELAGQDYIIDFEGSAILSVAQFYRNFGAISEPYPRYYKNKWLHP